MKKDITGHLFFEGPKQHSGCVARGWRGKACGAIKWVNTVFERPTLFQKVL